MSYLEIITAATGGGLMGFSIGIGIKPRWKQPKNIKIQLITGVIGLIITISYITWLTTKS